MKVLISCEESQTVCKEFRKLGHEAYSCDVLPCSGGHPEWHIQNDVLNILGKNFWNQNKGWDLMIAFPPCTDLSYAGVRWFKQKIADGRQQKAIEFFMKLANSKIDKICLENPLGVISKEWRKHDQIINPFNFGHRERKRTCLWMKNLPLLIPTNEVKPEEPVSIDKTTGHKRYFTDAINRSSIQRSKTFPGIAKAFAQQYHEFIYSGLTVQEWEEKQNIHK